MESRRDHLDALELGPHAPRIVVNTELRPLGHVQQHKNRSLCKEPSRQFGLHLGLGRMRVMLGWASNRVKQERS